MKLVIFILLISLILSKSVSSVIILSILFTFIVAAWIASLGFKLKFFINSKDSWGGELIIRKEDYPFLDHDSYNGCASPISYPPHTNIPDNCEVTPCLTSETLTDLILFIPSVKQLTPIDKTKIVAVLKARRDEVRQCQ